MALFLLLIVSAATAYGQNSDLGVLGGLTHYSSETRFGTQVNYAFQFWERPAGRLYVELPVIIPVSPKGESNSVRIFVAPGVRYHFNVTPRVVIYAAIGGGFAVRPKNSRASGAFAYGGGIDVRLNRLWSLRGDMRNLITSRSTGGDEGYNPSLMFGAALHF